MKGAILYIHNMRTTGKLVDLNLTIVTSGFVLYLQIPALEPSPTVRADALNYSQMSLVHVTRESILPDDL
jgi:hypothetical protein